MFLTTTEIKDAIGMALSSVRTNKLRSGLTILGVMIGVSSVIGLASVINGLNGAMEEQIESLGSTTIIEVTKLPAMTDWDDLTEEQRNRPEMTVGEAEAIKNNCPDVDGVAPMNHWWAPGGNMAKYENRSASRIKFLGTWPDYIRVRDKNVVNGRFISHMDLQIRAMVCVLGFDIAKTLFENQDPIGKEIRVNGDKFEVIGVLEKVEANFGDNGDNNMVVIPLSTKEKLQPDDKALSLAVRAVSLDKLDEAQEEIIGALRVYRRVPFNKENNFELATQDVYKDQINNITKYIYLAMLIITSVGLMVGGIGVMNIMLVSVTERTREIGVRKAIGAKRSNITLQFLTEAMTLTGAGGIIGIIMGILLGVVVNSLAGFPLTVSLFWIVVGFVVAVGVGLVSGMYPALKAARLDPIEALRYE